MFFARLLDFSRCKVEKCTFGWRDREGGRLRSIEERERERYYSRSKSGERQRGRRRKGVAFCCHASAARVPQPLGLSVTDTRRVAEHIPGRRSSSLLIPRIAAPAVLLPPLSLSLAASRVLHAQWGSSGCLSCRANRPGTRGAGKECGASGVRSISDMYAGDAHHCRSTAESACATQLSRQIKKLIREREKGVKSETHTHTLAHRHPE